MIKYQEKKHDIVHVINRFKNLQKVRIDIRRHTKKVLLRNYQQKVQYRRFTQ